MLSDPPPPKLYVLIYLSYFFSDITDIWKQPITQFGIEQFRICPEQDPLSPLFMSRQMAQIKVINVQSASTAIDLAGVHLHDDGVGREGSRAHCQTG